jgi:hypothetical protein
MRQMESKHTVFDSVDDMLAPETLSERLNRAVTRVELQPYKEHNGLAGGTLSYVETDAERLVLKRMSITSDWIMYISDDDQGRSVTLWEYGLLDQLLPTVEHKIIGAARDGEGWAILGEDLTGKFFNWDNFPPKFIPVFLDTLARIHATFWNDPRLRDPRLGLGDAAFVLNFYLRARAYTGDSHGVLPHWFREGWEAMQELLDANIYRHMVALHEDPEPLLNALDRYPVTLLHGDYRAENLAYNGKPIAIDWQMAKCSLMTIDLAWLASSGGVQDVMSKVEANRYYRERLETYLKQRFGDQEWEAMVQLGYAVNALFSTCLSAYFYKMSDEPVGRAFHERVIKEKGQAFMDGLRWL